MTKKRTREETSMKRKILLPVFLAVAFATMSTSVSWARSDCSQIENEMSVNETALNHVAGLFSVFYGAVGTDPSNWSTPAQETHDNLVAWQDILDDERDALEEAAWSAGC